MHLPLLFILAFRLTSATSAEVVAFPSSPSPQNATLEYMDPTVPPLLLPTQEPQCSLLLLQQDFADTFEAPPSIANYSAPLECPAPWSHVVLELSASASDSQKDRIASIWIDGAEILRTTTPFPMSSGVCWHVRKDVTRYTALLRRESSQLSMMLGNSNATFPGVYSVNVSLHFYRGAAHERTEDGQTLALESERVDASPADLILPVSRSGGDEGGGFWFKVTNESEVQVARIVIPRNAFQAVLEIHASHHGDDEYWYANPFRTSGSTEANGGFRQVVASIDGRHVGSVVPFPVIYPGSINPYFWAPVAAIGTYDHPSYNLDLTPFVGQLIDGQPHDFGLTIRDCQPYWLVDANLHLWLDALSDQVEGALVRYKVPPLRISKQADWEGEGGKSQVEGQVIVRFSGWVSSSKGNLTTNIRHKYKFKSHVGVEDKGNLKHVLMESRARTTTRIERDHKVIGRVSVETENPLQMVTWSSNGGGGTKIHKTRLSHGLTEVRSTTAGKGKSFSRVSNKQESTGSLLIGDQPIVGGSASTRSRYKFRDAERCYLRMVNMVGGKVEKDEESASCSAVAAS